MGLQAVFVALLLITNALSVLSQTSDPECLTPVNRNGFCVPIKRCRNIYNIVSDPTNTPSRGIQNYIRQAACTLPGVRRSVCCQPEEVTRAPTTTTTTTTAAPPVIPPPRKLNRSLFPTEDCGRYTQSRVSHGNVTAPFEFPWMVLLMYQSISTGNLTERCGGTLINYRYVLTAAHCMKKTDGMELAKVRLGEHDKNTTRDCIVFEDGDTDCAEPAFDVDIEETIIPANYGRQIRHRHDIGLIRMAVEVEFSHSVKPICLPVDESVRKNLPTKFIITGWGMTEKGKPSHVLLKAAVNHVSIPECQRKMNYYGLAIRLEKPWQMCAMGDNKVDSCQGDSGGPIGFGVSVSGSPRFVQFGIVSAGVHDCGIENAPGVYTSVSAYMDWIVENMRQ